MGQFGDIVVAKGCDAVFIDSASAHLRGVLVSPVGVFQSLPGVFLPGLAILFLMGFRSATMRVGGKIVQFGGSLMILVMRSVAITSRHL
jgi:hypothetical protein